MRYFPVEMMSPVIGISASESSKSRVFKSTSNMRRISSPSFGVNSFVLIILLTVLFNSNSVQIDVMQMYQPDVIAV